MNPALWGLMTALGWGSADFIARFTGRAMGHRTALLAMLAVGAVLLPLLVRAFGLTFVWTAEGLWLLALSGVGIMVATLLLYWALARGPVTVVAPIVGSYPGLVVAFAVLELGARPKAVQWAAMGAVLLGILLVARAADSFRDEAEYTRRALRGTLVIALASSLSFAIAVSAAQAAMPIYGELQTVCVARWISLAAAAVLFLVRREVPRVPLQWWPLVTAQGILDAGAYLALLLGSHGDGAAIAAAAASCFSAVTVILARLVLREAMIASQWAGVVLVIGGVGTLTGTAS